jgi:hypothetical protein
MLNDTRTHVQSGWKACNLRIRNRKWTYKEKMREWSKDARYTENKKTGYESISADRTVTAFISFRCLKAKKNTKMRIHPISGHSPWSYEFLPDGNLSLENEDMSGKMRTYGSPTINPSAWSDGQCPHSKNTICHGVTSTARNKQPD